MRKLLIPFLFSSVLFAKDPWTLTDTAWETAIFAASCVDLHQTQQINTRFHFENGKKIWDAEEGNLFLGSHPSNAEVNRYFITSMLLHFTIAYNISSNHRRTFQYVSLTFEAYEVRNNRQVNLSIRF